MCNQLSGLPSGSAHRWQWLHRHNCRCMVGGPAWAERGSTQKLRSPRVYREAGTHGRRTAHPRLARGMSMHEETGHEREGKSTRGWQRLRFYRFMINNKNNGYKYHQRERVRYYQVQNYDKTTVIPQKGQMHSEATWRHRLQPGHSQNSSLKLSTITQIMIGQ